MLYLVLLTFLLLLVTVIVQFFVPMWKDGLIDRLCGLLWHFHRPGSLDSLPGSSCGPPVRGDGPVLAIWFRGPSGHLEGRPLSHRIPGVRLRGGSWFLLPAKCTGVILSRNMMVPRPAVHRKYPTVRREGHYNLRFTCSTTRRLHSRAVIRIEARARRNTPSISSKRGAGSSC
jgi:hypothetical protein